MYTFTIFCISNFWKNIQAAGKIPTFLCQYFFVSRKILLCRRVFIENLERESHKEKRFAFESISFVSIWLTTSLNNSKRAEKADQSFIGDLSWVWWKINGNSVFTPTDSENTNAFSKNHSTTQLHAKCCNKSFESCTHNLLKIWTM